MRCTAGVEGIVEDTAGVETSTMHCGVVDNEHCGGGGNAYGTKYDTNRNLHGFPYEWTVRLQG